MSTILPRRGLSKSNSYDGGSPGVGRRPTCDPNSIRDILAKEAAAAVLAKPKSKSVKGVLRNRCASAQFYTKGIFIVKHTSLHNKYCYPSL